MGGGLRSRDEMEEARKGPQTFSMGKKGWGSCGEGGGGGSGRNPNSHPITVERGRKERV